MKVLVVYHMFPHYRRAVVKELQASNVHEFSFVGSQREHEGIPPIPAMEFNRFIEAPYIVFRGLYIQPYTVYLAAFADYDVYISLGNPNFLTSWAATAIARARRKTVLYWAHGWLRPEGWLKAKVRNIYYSLAHLTMVYGTRARVVAADSGFPLERTKTIYNSLDTADIGHHYKDVESNSSRELVFGSFFKNPSLPTIVCIARLTIACNFDLLIKAATLLKGRGRPINILFIGTGPEEISLKKMSTDLGVEAYFFGACYDEGTLAPLLYNSDLAVSPGKIGLTAMHCLSYGTPVASHDDLNLQMPEVESIVDGVTGFLFKRGDEKSLADGIERWLDSNEGRRDEVRRSCREEIESKWSPKRQSELIHSSIELALSRSGSQY